MAIDCTLLLTEDFTTNPDTTTSSISPVANQPVYIGISASGDLVLDPDTVVSVSGCNLTWSQLVEIQFGTRRHHTVWKGIGASPTTEGVTVTVTLDNGTWQETMVAIVQVTGADETTPNETAIAAAGAGGTTASVSGLGTPDAGDAVLAFFVHSGASSDMTIGAELDEELGELGGGANVRRIMAAWDSAPDSTPAPSATWSGAEDWAVIAFIINAAAGSSTIAPIAMHHLRQMRG